MNMSRMPLSFVAVGLLPSDSSRYVLLYILLNNTAEQLRIQVLKLDGLSLNPALSLKRYVTSTPLYLSSLICKMGIIKPVRKYQCFEEMNKSM